MTEKINKCPACAEVVLPEAKVCKHCGKELVAWYKKTASSGFVFIIILIILFSWWFYNSSV